MRSFCSLSAPLVASLVLTSAACGQLDRSGQVGRRFADLCASCHGVRLGGAQAPSMLDETWTFGGDDASLARSIRDGHPDKGMPPFGNVLSEKEIRAMVIFIREQNARAIRGQTVFAKPAESMRVSSKLHDYQLNTWVSDLDDPWSMTFLPDGTAIITEKRGRLLRVAPGETQAKEIKGLPEVDTGSQAGLFDVTPHPEYKTNGWLYLAYSHPRENAEGESVSLTRVFRAKLRDDALVEHETIFEAPVSVYPRRGGVHFGGRLAFDKKGFLFFTIGERGHGANSQNLSVPMGKVHRLHDDGRVPQDNPFVDQPGVVPSIWSYGHRNPQGLDFHPVTGALYDAEHGPRGGDELNLVQRGLNYGWPVITYGMNYDGTPMTELTAKEGMEQPVTYWVPSIAISGASFYTGDLFPKWKNHLFVASLAAEELRRLEITDGKVLDQEVLFKGLGRIRDVTGGPDGALYVLLPERIARLTPAK